jgi:hypothetical protein
MAIKRALGARPSEPKSLTTQVDGDVVRILRCRAGHGTHSHKSRFNAGRPGPFRGYPDDPTGLQAGGD